MKQILFIIIAPVVGPLFLAICFLVWLDFDDVEAEIVDFLVSTDFLFFIMCQAVRKLLQKNFSFHGFFHALPDLQVILIFYVQNLLFLTS